MPTSFNHTARSSVSNVLRGSRSACFAALLAICALGLLAMFFPQTVPLSGLELGLCVLVLLLLRMLGMVHIRSSALLQVRFLEVCICLCLCMFSFVFHLDCMVPRIHMSMLERRTNHHRLHRRPLH